MRQCSQSGGYNAFDVGFEKTIELFDVS